MVSNYQVLEKAPELNAFLSLRKTTSWGTVPIKLVRKSLNNSLYNVAIYHKNVLIGMGRVVGDGYLYFYIQDVVVSPDHQGQGVGDLIMRNIESYISKNAQSGSTIGLFSAKGSEAFYKKFGYQDRSGNPLGLGMCKFM